MIKRSTLTLFALLLSLASFATITGSTSICLTSPENYTDSGPGGGTWSSSNPVVAFVTSSSGATATVTGISAGTTTISYVVGSTVSTMTVTVNVAPGPIIGGSVTACGGTSVTLSNATTGGSWTSSTGSIYYSSGSVMLGVPYYLPAGSLVTVGYAIGSCSVTSTVTVNNTPHDSVSGPNLVCTGATIALTSGTPGGTWSTSDPTIATVSSSGAATGVAPGTATISYTTTGACGPYSAALVVTVTGTSVAPTWALPAFPTMPVSSSQLLIADISGGTWTSSNPSVAAVSAVGVASGSVLGVSPGTVTISYGVPGCTSGSTVYVTHAFTVTGTDGISGQVRYSGTQSVKIWLIKYDPSTQMLTAVDSTTGLSTDSTFYSFTGLPTDSFRVKAMLTSSVSGYVPTYHTSSIYWNAASVIYHTAGMLDAHKDINMIAGTPVSGPGFIGGSVITGANKGTTDGAAVPGMAVYLLNSATKAVVGYAITDAAGEYSFSNLPIGIYDVFPEELSYITTPYASITLTPGATSMSTAKFMQRTVSKKITPIGTVAVNELERVNTSISAFPNPTMGKLNINWEAATSEAATLIITDVTGREVLTKDFSMTKGNGGKVIDLSSLTNGMYFISVHSADISYINKIEVRH